MSEIACKEDLIEELADKEHEGWSRWMKYLFSKCEQGNFGQMVIPPEFVARWLGQAETPYAQLSAREKESDRAEVAHILPLIEAYAGNAIGPPHPLYVPLWRIAVALEEQNRFNWQWLEQNKVWHEENKEYPSRMLAIHEESAARDQAHRERMERVAEEQATFTNELMQKSYEAYLSSLKSPSKELVQAVREALASDMRTSTGEYARYERVTYGQ